MRVHQVMLVRPVMEEIVRRDVSTRRAQIAVESRRKRTVETRVTLRREMRQSLTRESTLLLACARLVRRAALVSRSGVARCRSGTLSKPVHTHARTERALEAASLLQKRCDGANSQVCDAAGTWQTDTACPFVCSDPTCTGTCVPGSNRCSGLEVETCAANGTWVNCC